MPPKRTCEDSTDTGTLRPNKALISTENNHFEPMDCPYFHQTIELPDSVDPTYLINLFLLYYTPDIVAWIVECTNTYT